jgi:hypothetical protein
MRQFSLDHQLKPAALLMLGDNFYGKLDGGINDPRWKTQFEDMYPKTSFDCPCYAVLGNHDYIIQPATKADSQLEYAKKEGTRWTMPNKWYRFALPAVDPVVTFIALDSNYQNASMGKTTSLTPQERKAQLAWLKEELAKPLTTPFLIVYGHHPLYSNGPHGDSPALIKQWDALFREHRVHVYLCGHDHDLQHLEFSGHPTSFVVSGGGGANLTELKLHAEERGPFAQRMSGFTHLQATKERLIVRHLDASGKALHAFAKRPDGTVSPV